MNIRLLNADEIECRVAQVVKTQRGVSCSLLLYKDARCDMSILDEVYGARNWQREHVIIDGRLYCNVSVWDDGKGQWIVKQDVGTESNTEKEKGQASDSFKRACTNWGIGRELYTAPTIWVSLGEKEYSEQNGRIKCKQSFRVRGIRYEKRKISALIIEDRNGSERFRMGTLAEEETVGEVQMETIKKIAKALGATTKKQFAETIGFPLDDLPKLKMSAFGALMQELNKKMDEKDHQKAMEPGKNDA